MLISLKEYAEKHNRELVSVRQKAKRGNFKTAIKIGRNWVIDSEELYGRTVIQKSTEEKK